MRQNILLLSALLAPLSALGCTCSPGSDAERSAQQNCRTKLWDIQPLNYSDASYGGYPKIDVSHRVVFHKGTSVNRTYSHHPMLLKVGPTVILAHSSALEDEDSMGMTVWGGVSHDGGVTWTKSQELFPRPLLPNQTYEYNLAYWCSRRIPQRTIAPEAVVRSPISGVIYVVGATRNFYCDDGTDANKAPRSAGRLARPIDVTTGSPAGDPCWTLTNHFTYDLGFDKTVYGTQYGMKFCEEADIINEIFTWPLGGPSWARIYNNGKLFTVNQTGDVEEPTLGLYDSSRDVFQRFWRDTSAVAVPRVWTECACNSSNWYPNDLAVNDKDNVQNATRPIYSTDIPDQRTKQWFDTFATVEHPKVRYLVHNPRDNPEKVRYPLTIAWQGLNDTDATWSFKKIGVVDTDPPTNIVPDGRKLKRPSYSYPNAVQFDDHLVVAYSQNKEDIKVSLVPLSALT